MIQISIIIVTHTYAETLRSCLEAMLHQTQPASEFEVIVLVDGATDHVRDLLASLTPPFQLRIIKQKNSGPGAARNHGVEVAAGHYCLFLDEEILATPGLIEEHLRTQRAQGGVIGLGRVIHRFPQGENELTQCFSEKRDDHVLGLDLPYEPAYLDGSSGNLSVPRSVLAAAGCSAVDLPRAELSELRYRLDRQGLPCVYIPDAVGQRNYRKGRSKLLADIEGAGAAELELYRRHPALLPALRLGSFNKASLWEILGRRALLAIKAPPRFLAPIALLLEGSSWSRSWQLFFRRYCFWLDVQRAIPDRESWQRLTRGPVILMYHAFGKPGEPPSRYILPRRRFGLQMAWLKWRGYHVLSLAELLRYRDAHRLPPARSIVITIDDGYADSGSVAYPILRRYGFPATVYLVSKLVGAANQWDKNGEQVRRPLLSWSAIREMKEGGIEFGAHSRTHAKLTTLSEGQVKDEVAGSKADLEAELGTPVLTFAYPYGKYNSTSQAEVEQAGFGGACTCEEGVNDPAVHSYALRRAEIRGTDTLLRFALALWSGSGRTAEPRRVQVRPKGVVA